MSKKSGPSAALRVVYVSYDGMDEPLGRSQVLPYLRGLAARGHTFDLISFEKPGVRLRFREPLEPGIAWTALRYHKRPTVPATAFDMLQGLSATSLFCLLSNADLVHVRSYVPAAAVMPLVSFKQVPLLFDMRGFWADEKREDGTWERRPRLYEATKVVERMLLERASAITVLTHSMRRYFREEYPHAARVTAPIQVIPTCTDLDRFRPDVAPNPEVLRALGSAFVLTYVGSIGGRYLSEEMARFYLAFRQVLSPARFLVVSRNEPDILRRVLREAGAESELVHRTVAHHDVPAYVRAAHAGVFFYRETFGSRGCAPTKLGELLSAGVPVVGNDIGDIAEVLRGEEVGVVAKDFSPDAMARAAAKIAEIVRRPRTAERARAVAESYFSLDEAVEAYDALYRGMKSGAPISDASWPRTSVRQNGATHRASVVSAS